MLLIIDIDSRIYDRLRLRLTMWLYCILDIMMYVY